MCGVFGFTVKDLSYKYGSKWHVEKYMSWSPRYNIRPTQSSPVIVKNKGINQMELMRFGLIPSWSKTVKLDFPTINARVETVAKLPTFARPFKSQRVCILSTGFFEWKLMPDSRKQPFYFHFKDNRPFCLAGIYDVNSLASEKEIKSYTIITQPAGHLVGDVHPRQPVILDDEKVNEWLNPENQNPEQLLKLLNPISINDMETYPVSLLVNNSRIDTPEIIRPLK